MVNPLRKIQIKEEKEVRRESKNVIQVRAIQSTCVQGVIIDLGTGSACIDVDAK